MGLSVQAQTYLITNGTVNTCSGTFFDTGGAMATTRILLILYVLLVGSVFRQILLHSI